MENGKFVYNNDNEYKILMKIIIIVPAFGTKCRN